MPPKMCGPIVRAYRHGPSGAPVDSCWLDASVEKKTPRPGCRDQFPGRGWKCWKSIPISNNCNPGPARQIASTPWARSFFENVQGLHGMNPALAQKAAVQEFNPSVLRWELQNSRTFNPKGFRGFVGAVFARTLAYGSPEGTPGCFIAKNAGVL